METECAIIQPFYMVRRIFVKTLALSALGMLVSCDGSNCAESKLPSPATIGEVPAPEGFRRVTVRDSSFGYWLRKYKLKADKTVRYFIGRVKGDQSGVYAVLGTRTGERDLQQCADAVIRLRAEYLLWSGRLNDIEFHSTSMQKMNFLRWCNGERFSLSNNKLVPYNTTTVSEPGKQSLDRWLDFVFVYAGTISLPKELKAKTGTSSPVPGDVIVESGSPGHAMIVVDVVVNDKNERRYLLAQSYMPAQDMHIVNNKSNGECNPWYKTGPASNGLTTADWKFKELKFYEWK